MKSETGQITLNGVILLKNHCPLLLMIICPQLFYKDNRVVSSERVPVNLILLLDLDFSHSDIVLYVVYFKDSNFIDKINIPY